MARRRDFVRGAVAIRSSRETTWFRFASGETTLSASAAIFSFNAAALAMRPFTIIRTHFEFAVRSDQAAAIEHQGVGVGLGVVSDQAVAVGVSALPTPITDLASHLWFLHKIIYADESALTDRTRPQTNVSVDSKAMRKVEVGSDLVVMAELTGFSLGAIVTVGGRILVKNN